MGDLLGSLTMECDLTSSALLVGKTGAPLVGLFLVVLSYYLYQISLSQVAVKGSTTPLLHWLQVLCLFV